MSGLYASQKEALGKLKTGSVLCGGVGTGKSRTALAYFTLKVCGGYSTYDNEHGVLRRPRPLYVITTAKKRDSLDWEKEAAPFLISMGTCSVADFHVDSWNNVSKYVDVQDAFFIFDEQRIVGKGTWSKSFLKITKNNDWIVLTATPGDIWMDYATLFIANGFFRNRTHFEREHVVYNRFAKFPKVDRYVNTSKLEKLRSKIVVNMDSEKVAVRHHEWVKVGYDEKTYEIISDKRWNPFEDKPIQNASQYCQLSRKVVNENPRRLQAMKNIMDNHSRVIVFYSFNYELRMMEEMLNSMGVSYSQWNGRKHQPIPDSDKWVYLVQYTSGAEGWNCIETDTVIFFSLNYSYKIVEQACGRIDRINTPYTDLYYYHIFTDSDIDKAIRACLKRKTVFNERAFANF